MLREFSGPFGFHPPCGHEVTNQQLEPLIDAWATEHGIQRTKPYEHRSVERYASSLTSLAANHNGAHVILDLAVIRGKRTDRAKKKIVKTNSLLPEEVQAEHDFRKVNTSTP